MEQVLYKLPDGWEWQELADVVVKTENLNPLKHADQLWTYIDISSVDRDRFAVYGGANVYTNVRKNYLAECPNVGQLVKNLEFNLEMENELMER